MFSKEQIKLNSGQLSDFKIECDSLTVEDWECLAYLISKRLQFRSVLSVPKGGDKLASYLSGYCQDNKALPLLICDDVLTTGNSMEKVKEQIGQDNIIGVVIFSRGKCPKWITPIFQMWKTLKSKANGKGRSNLDKAHTVYLYDLTGDRLGKFKSVRSVARYLKFNEETVVSAYRRKRPLYKMYYISKSNVFDFINNKTSSLDISHKIYKRK